MEQLNLSAVKTQVICASDGNKHIFFGVDNEFVSHALITIMSLIDNAGESLYQFHIISSELNDADTTRIKKILDGTPHGLTYHHVGDELFSLLPTTSLFTKATYYRLLAPLLLPDADKVLYLDADMVCLNSPEELWTIPTGDNDIALVVSESDILKDELVRNAGLIGTSYFNAGMMLIDVARWNRSHISEKAFSLLNNREIRLKYLDQDALNIILEGSVRYVSRRFNYIEMLAHNEHGYRTDVPSDTCILHYAGADKPWHEWNQQQVCKYYRNIYRRSPLAEHPLYLPKNHSQAKRMYKTMFRNRQLLRAVYWRVRYYQMRYL